MSDPVETPSFSRSGRFRAIVVVLLLAAVGGGTWWWLTRGRESTDDAQVDARVTQIARFCDG